MILGVEESRRKKRGGKWGGFGLILMKIGRYFLGGDQNPEGSNLGSKFGLEQGFSSYLSV